MTKLASCEIIKNIIPHNNADNLEITEILGYKAIVQKGLYTKGSKIIFIFPDTVLPEKPWAAFYKSKSKRVRAVKLRNVWSMGIVESLDILPVESDWTDLKEGSEVSEILGIQKYEPPAPQDLSAKGNLPFGIFKTDEENWQSADVPYGEICDVTFKVEGQSASYAYKNVPDREPFAICSRSLEIKPECENNFTRIAAKYDIKNKLTKFCQDNNVNLCLRGEAFGGNIQNFKPNPHAGAPLDFALYNVLNLDTLKYETKDSPFYYTKVAAALGLKTVDLLEENVIITPELIEKYDSKLEKINGKYYEGVVCKLVKGGSFKVRNKIFDSLK